MAKRNRLALKAYFEQGARPTQEQFAELIDSMLNFGDDGIEKSPGQPLKVTGGLEMDGNIVMNKGNITAESFIGSGSGLTNLNASEIKAGTLDINRISKKIDLDIGHNSFKLLFDNGGIEKLPAQPIQVTGELEVNGNIVANSFEGSGNLLTNLNASEIKAGTLDINRISKEIDLNIGSNSFKLLFDNGGIEKSSGQPLKVTGELKVDGELSVEGNIKANSFEGSGNLLTNLDASKINLKIGSNQLTLIELVEARLFGNVDYSKRFLKVNDELVMDLTTGLIWLKNANYLSYKLNWVNAEYNCNNLNKGGFNDWRLPTKKELQNLIGKTEFSESDWNSFGIEKMQREEYYWSSDGHSTNSAFVVRSNHSDDSNHDDKNQGLYYLWPVRERHPTDRLPMVTT